MTRLVKIEGAGQGAFVDDELVMIHAETGTFFALKDTGLAVWNLLDAESDLDAICQSLEARFEVEPDVCQAQVRAFAGQLVEAGFARFC